MSKYLPVTSFWHPFSPAPGAAALLWPPSLRHWRFVWLPCG